ncbi:MAG: FKBP-type peptidyl-prolyl cis-trans isomerase [Bacteroidales bacterium]|nr:FKBP-type peptidyl-prolyl cis-trans isomerase [Bacteroidales bacterium]
MKKIIIACGALVMLLSTASCGGSSSAEPKDLADSMAYYIGRSQGAQFAQHFSTLPEADREKIKKESFLRGFKQIISQADTNDMGYLYGVNFGMQVAQQLLQCQQNGINVNSEELYRNFASAFMADSVNAQTINADNTGFQATMMKVQQVQRDRQDAARRAAREAKEAEANQNIEAGKKYIDQLKANDSSIQTTESGLSYKVVKQGSGKLPAKDGKVKVKYTGKLIDGTEFDSSKGEAVEFPMTGVIAGFAEGLAMMNPGSQYILYIPSDIAYGNNSQGNIPGGSTLVFDVEMVSVE